MNATLVSGLLGLHPSRVAVGSAPGQGCSGFLFGSRSSRQLLRLAGEVDELGPVSLPIGAHALFREAEDAFTFVGRAASGKGNFAAHLFDLTTSAPGVVIQQADTLAAGLADSGRRYGEVEDRLAIMGRRVIG